MASEDGLAAISIVVAGAATAVEDELALDCVADGVVVAKIS